MEPKAKANAGQVSVTTWENERNVNGENRKILSFSIQKRYKDGEEWKTASSYNLNDLPKLITCLQKAYNDAVFKGD